MEGAVQPAVSLDGFSDHCFGLFRDRDIPFGCTKSAKKVTRNSGLGQLLVFPARTADNLSRRSPRGDRDCPVT
jgi:hypothetical protein